MSGHCHKLVAKVAREAAGELYETLMGDNVCREVWKKANPGLSEKALAAKFVATKWALCIPFARATLAQLLTKGLDAGLKDDIMEALILDSTLRYGRAGRGKVVGAVGGTN